MATRKKSPKKAATSRAKAKSTRKAARRAPARRKAAPKKPGLVRLLDASPTFTVNDIERSVAFYRDVLGCAVTRRWERDGQLAGVEVTAGDVTFGLTQDDWQKGRDRVKGVGLRIYCGTRQDVDGIAKGMKARGAVLDAEPASSPWGRHFAITDPDGFRITIVNERQKG